MHAVGMILLVCGFAVLLISGIWLLVVAFQQSALWGLGCMFVPFVSLAFVIRYWDKAAKPCFVQVAALILIIGGGVSLTGP